VQAEQLDDLLDQLGQPIDLAVLIAVDVDLIMQRLLGRRSCLTCGASYNIFFAPPKMDDRCDECGGRLRQRADDNEEIIGNRLRTYEIQTTPVIERYREQGRLRVVQGSAALEDVFKAVVNVIEEARPSFHSRDRSAAIRRAVVRKLLEQREVEAQPDVGKQAAAQPQGDERKPPAAKPEAAAGAGRVAADSCCQEEDGRKKEGCPQEEDGCKKEGCRQEEGRSEKQGCDQEDGGGEKEGCRQDEGDSEKEEHRRQENNGGEQEDRCQENSCDEKEGGGEKESCRQEEACGCEEEGGGEEKAGVKDGREKQGCCQESAGAQEGRDPQGGGEKESRKKIGQEALARMSMRRCARSVVVILRS
jgi:hypothetical protein